MDLAELSRLAALRPVSDANYVWATIRLRRQDHW